MRRLLLAGIFGACAFAQGPTEPPPIVQLVRKPGVTTNLARPYADAKAAIDVVGLTATTGVPETWLLESHQSFASIEDLDKRLQSVAPMRMADTSSDPFQDDVLAPARTMIATYRPGWSYRPDQAIRMFPRAHYFYISIYRIRAGTEADFGELIRLRRLNQDSVNQDRPDIVYQVISGAPSGTFIFLAPITSLRVFDEGIANTPVYAEGLAEARSKTRTQVAPDTELNRERLLFRVEPRLSYVSDDFAAAEKDFWRPKN